MSTFIKNRIARNDIVYIWCSTVFTELLKIKKHRDKIVKTKNLKKSLKF